MSDGLLRFHWTYAGDELVIFTEEFSTRVSIRGYLAALVVRNIECLDAPAVNLFLAGLFSAGLAHSCDALRTLQVAEVAHG